jgi:RNA polymerase sigma-70 factor (ECF subfamily)
MTMATAPILERARLESWTDEQVVERVLAGETAAFEVLMRRYNQRLYRVARAILRDDAEAEDVMQDAYVRAYQHLSQFAGRARFATWLTRIAVHEALARSHRRARVTALDGIAGPDGEFVMPTAPSTSPEYQASARETSRLLEDAILALPDAYRTVIMLRDIEEMNTAEAAACLDISEDNLKVRLHRARALLRRELFARAGASSSSAFEFPATRCDRIVANVFARLARLDSNSPTP